MNQEKERAAPLGKAERDELITKHLWLVKQIYYELRKTPMAVKLRDDLIGEGNLALVLAANEFDPSRGTEFRYFAQGRIRSAMLRFLGKETDYAKQTVSLNDKCCRAAFYGDADDGSDGESHGGYIGGGYHGGGYGGDSDEES